MGIGGGRPGSSIGRGAARYAVPQRRALGFKGDREGADGNWWRQGIRCVWFSSPQLRHVAPANTARMAKLIKFVVRSAPRLASWGGVGAAATPAGTAEGPRGLIPLPLGDRSSQATHKPFGAFVAPVPMTAAARSSRAVRDCPSICQADRITNSTPPRLSPRRPAQDAVKFVSQSCRTPRASWMCKGDCGMGYPNGGCSGWQA